MNSSLYFQSVIVLLPIFLPIVLGGGYGGGVNGGQSNSWRKQDVMKIIDKQVVTNL